MNAEPALSTGELIGWLLLISFALGYVLVNVVAWVTFRVTAWYSRRRKTG